jgi:hypothetical protein
MYRNTNLRSRRDRLASFAPPDNWKATTLIADPGPYALAAAFLNRWAGQRRWFLVYLEQVLALALAKGKPLRRKHWGADAFTRS